MFGNPPEQDFGEKPPIDRPPAGPPLGSPKRKRIFEGLGHELIRALQEKDLTRAQGLIMGGVEVDFFSTDHSAGSMNQSTPLHI